MGDIVEEILSGCIYQECNSFIDPEGVGYPVTCSDCLKEGKK